MADARNHQKLKNIDGKKKKKIRDIDKLCDANKAGSK